MIAYILYYPIEMLSYRIYSIVISQNRIILYLISVLCAVLYRINVAWVYLYYTILWHPLCQSYHLLKGIVSPILGEGFNIASVLCPIPCHVNEIKCV